MLNSKITHPMHQFVPANRDIDMRRQTSTGDSQGSQRFDTVDRVASRAGTVELVRSLMSATIAYSGYQSWDLDYRYSSLGTEEDAIRLLALFPDQKAEELKCKIVHTTLSEKPHYEALSYTWGQVKSCAWIELENVLFPVTTNLYGALKDLRLVDQIRYLWVDSLCIDQCNDREKCTQVQRMAIIYSQAHRVLAWLGPSASDSDMAIDFINGDITAGSEEAETPEPFWESIDREITVGMVGLETPDAIQLTEDAMYDVSDSPTSTKEGDRRVAEAGDVSATSILDELRSSENRHDSEGLPLRGLDSSLKESGNNENGVENNRRSFVSERDYNEIIHDTEAYDNHAPEFRKMKPKTHLQRALVAVDCLVRRPWWRRVWVSQEVASAALEPILICGRRAFTMGQLQDATKQKDSMLATWRTTTAGRVATSVSYRVSTLAGMRRMFRQEWLSPESSGSPRLAQLLRGSLTLEATDARDKVYALLSLADDREELGLVPDYTKSLNEVYTDVTRNVNRTTGSLNLLCINTNSERLISSWASDWSLGSSRPKSLWASGHYKAAANWAVVAFPIKDPSILDVGGKSVDDVAFKSRAIYLGRGDLSGRDFYTIRDTILGLMSLVYDSMREIMSYPDHLVNKNVIRRNMLRLEPDPRNSDAFWRTLIANETAFTAIETSKNMLSTTISTPAPEEFANMFEILLYSSEDGSEVDSTNHTWPRRRLREMFESVVQTPRLRTKHFSRVPHDFMPGLSFSKRRAEYLRPLLTMLQLKLAGRVLFITTEGYMGLCSVGVEEGDVVSIILGCDMPILLRKRDESHRRVIGEAYVHGIMNGEALNGLTMENYTTFVRRFSLK